MHIPNAWLYVKRNILNLGVGREYCQYLWYVSDSSIPFNWDLEGDCILDST